MKTLLFDIALQATAATVWQALWREDSYAHWTSELGMGSRIESSWVQGGPVRFMDKTGNGIYGIIDELEENQSVSFVNLGELFEGREQVVDERTSAIEWSGAVETYKLYEKNGITRLWVEMEVVERDVLLFAEKFPKALKKLKQMVEPGEEFLSAHSAENYELKLAV